jgi:hypothetical protein
VTKLYDLLKARWNRLDSSSDFQPQEALIAAHRQLAHKDYEAKHIFVIVLTPDDDLKFLSAGKASGSELIGMFERAKCHVMGM